ncbi:MAG: AMP-binding protein [Chloroflexota bacterium]
MAVIPKFKRGEFYDELETMPPDQRERYLNQRLTDAVELAYYKAPAAKVLMDRAGLSPDDIRTIRDLEKLPITRKIDLLELEKKHPPYGGFLTVPVDEVERVFVTPGPLYEPMQIEAIRWFAKAFWAAGFRKGDVVVNTFTYHMSPAGVLMHESLRDCGATVVPMGTGNTEIQIQTIRDLKVNGYIGTPSFLITIIKRAEELGIDIRQQMPLRKSWFTGEMLAPSVRKTLEETYQISTAQAYAVTEPGGAIAYECRQKSGMHLMDDYVIEIVDPRTGKQMAPGEQGEIVATPIHNKTWGLLRFGTGDISYLIVEPCPCGRTAYRLGPLVGRTTDAVKVRGMFVVAKQAEQVINSFEPVSKFQFIIGRKGQRDETTLKAELKTGDCDKTKLADDVNRKFQDVCRLRIDRFEFVDKGTMPAELKIIVDERRWD